MSRKREERDKESYIASLAISWLARLTESFSRPTGFTVIATPL